jgi:hypothetical protein
MKLRKVRTFPIRTLITSVVILLPFSFSISNASAGVHFNVSDASVLQVKYLGGDNDALFFNVKYENSAGNSFKLLVLEENTGDALFQHSYSSRDFDKKLKIPRLTDTDYVTFLIRSAKQNIQLSYKVRVTTKVDD